MIKPGVYHIILPTAQLRQERVRCHIENSIHRHKYHIEETFQAICGDRTLRENCCNSDIANPNWNYNWCHQCVKLLPWTDEGKRLWLERHGIDTYSQATD